MRLSHSEVRALHAVLKRNGGQQFTVGARPAAPAAAPSTSGMPFAVRLLPFVAASTGYATELRRSGDHAAAIGSAAIHGGTAVAARALFSTIAGYAPAVAGTIARGNMIALAGMTAWNAGAAAVDGYRRGGVKEAARGAAFGAADTVTFGGASIARAYLDDRAKRKAIAAAGGSSAGPNLAAATRPSSDGMTAGYTRLDPRTGLPVRVGQYRTPT